MKALDKRRKQIKMLRQRGLSYTAIGTLLGITRQRAHQIGRVK
jgi:predicted transcriptional regulator